MSKMSLPVNNEVVYIVPEAQRDIPLLSNAGTQPIPNLDGQLPLIRLNAQIDFYQFEKIGHKFVAVNLTGTNVAASDVGRLAYAQDDLKGWFTESVTITMSFFSLPDIQIAQDTPATTTQTGQTTTSESYSVNADTGFFGATGTGSGSAGLTISQSFSTTYPAFKIANTSSNTVVRHSYLLGATASGRPFTQPGDLEDVSAEGFFKGFPLFDPPDQAVSNLPIISQAVFLTPPDAPDSKFTIRIEHSLLAVARDVGGGPLRVEHKQADFARQTWSHEWEPVVPLSQISPT